MRASIGCDVRKAAIAVPYGSPRGVGISTTGPFPLQCLLTTKREAPMTGWSFIERIVVPTVMLCLLAGGVGGLIFGCALALRSGSTLQFIARMNRWVSTREALQPLEMPRQIEPAPESPYRRMLGILFIIGGALTIYFLLTRLQVARLVDARRALGLAIVLDAIKAVFLAGGAFALIIGALMVFWPQRLTALEGDRKSTRLNSSH